MKADLKNILPSSVTNTNMGNFQRFISNMKDAIAYFGFRQVFLQPRIHR
ncbi:hypothetical protein [Calothrix sp. UHCC 0171]|nr:hypothetical protein [Calothrix sp. UHCC 0171]MEA5571741.1 hypothetical protein [Calothrix sp. UHCC 0171]